MKRLAAIGLACLLAACQSDLYELLPDKPEKVADFPATTAADLSACVYRAAQSTISLYVFHLNARADHLDFLITATRVAEKSVQPRLTKLELHFTTKGEITTVEMRESAIGDHELARQLWSIVERCAEQVAKPSAEKSTAP